MSFHARSPQENTIVTLEKSVMLPFCIFVKDIKGKLFADKGYISQHLFNRLFVDGIQLVTKLKRNMKGKVLDLSNRLMLRKRAVIETINDELKNVCQIEHSRHRSFHNFMVNLISGIAAYCFLPKKPSVNLPFESSNELVLF